ncbi:hypothetical protein ABZ636_39720 [Streptomyces sp. NPDC007251]|uniref:hypothetical protein n=1 Tax=Streptomyces sp. NPDC007251 TaxID=3154483 RepID=UPI0033D7B0CA
MTELLSPDRETAPRQHEPHGPQGIQAGQRVTVDDQDVGAAPCGEAADLIAQPESFPTC